MYDQDDDAAYPRAFKPYLIERWPLGKDWVPPLIPAGSSLTRDYTRLHAARHDGGIPPLLASFVRDLDRGTQGLILKARGESFTASAEVVAGVIAQLRSSDNRETRERLAVLHFFQWREVHPDLPDWCDSQALNERTAYRWCNEAVAMVWKYLVARHRGFGVAGLSPSKHPDSGNRSVT